jgi:hypothetical protein
MILIFPFVSVTDVERVFGGVPNLEELRNACPAEHDSGITNWNSAASAIFSTGWTDARQTMAASLFITEDAKIAKKQVDYLSAVLKCYALSHREKLAICGWLLSLMFRECPNW